MSEQSSFTPKQRTFLRQVLEGRETLQQIQFKLQIRADLLERWWVQKPFRKQVARHMRFLAWRCKLEFHVAANPAAQVMTGFARGVHTNNIAADNLQRLTSLNITSTVKDAHSNKARMRFKRGRDDQADPGPPMIRPHPDLAPEHVVELQRILDE